jgi:hypothetical protein
MQAAESLSVSSKCPQGRPVQECNQGRVFEETAAFQEQSKHPRSPGGEFLDPSGPEPQRLPRLKDLVRDRSAVANRDSYRRHVERQPDRWWGKGEQHGVSANERVATDMFVGVPRQHIEGDSRCGSGRLRQQRCGQHLVVLQSLKHRRTVIEKIKQLVLSAISQRDFRKEVVYLAHERIGAAWENGPEHTHVPRGGQPSQRWPRVQQRPYPARLLVAE